jgi:DNA-binding NarL/FixJ family response regulator
MQNIRMLIVDDHTLVRETWSYIFSKNPQFEVVGEASTAEQAIEMVQHLFPDIVIMDINLPFMNGIAATSHILKLTPNSKILAVSLHTEPIYAKKIMQNGAMGYVTKNSTREEMFEAITQISLGKKYVCKEIKDKLSEQLTSNDDVAQTVRSLSVREIEIIRLVKEGLSSKEIAEKLFIALKTVEVHRHNILRKLKLKNTASLIQYIHKNQLEIMA